MYIIGMTSASTIYCSEVYYYLAIGIKSVCCQFTVLSKCSVLSVELKLSAWIMHQCSTPSMYNQNGVILFTRYGLLFCLYTTDFIHYTQLNCIWFAVYSYIIIYITHHQIVHHSS